MARYKHIDMSPRLLPVDLQAQLVPGTFAHALHHLVDELDLSAFDAQYNNDETGAPAHAPGMLLRAVLLGYSQVSHCLRKNVTELSRCLTSNATGDCRRHHAAFIPSEALLATR